MLLCLCGKLNNYFENMQEVDSHLQHLQIGDEMKRMAFSYFTLYCLQLNLFTGDIDKAIEYYLRLKSISTNVMEGSIVSQCCLFYFALVSFSDFRKSRKHNSKVEAKKYMDSIKQLVDGGAMNLGHKYLLLEAESMTFTSKDNNLILKKYDQAISTAARAGFLQDSAVASLLCGLYCIGEEFDAKSYILRSNEMFRAWGAIGVADSLARRYSQYFCDNLQLTKQVSSSVRSRPHYRESVFHMHKSISPSIDPRDTKAYSITSM